MNISLRTNNARPRSVYSFEPRSYDGSGNNLDQVELGSSHTAFGRLASPAYKDGIAAPSGQDRPSARAVSNVVCEQADGDKSGKDLSGMVWLWGQFLDHDITLTPNGGQADFNIPVPAGDPYFDPRNTGTQTLSFARSVPFPGSGEDSPREQINAITSWIDGSMVYGSDQSRADALRSFQGGRMKTSEGDLLPYNTDGLANENPTRRPVESLFLAGDVRANENVALSSLHTVFMREHNRLADEISQDNPELDDEAVYQRARKMVGAQIQAITFNEFLPALLGDNAIPEYTGYNPEVDPTISNEFATAAYRLGHTMIENKIWRNEVTGEPRPEGDLEIKDAFFSPEKL
ncbi:MAG: peroxidase family protein, partial [Candidatus Eremiobacteraeota bacterium]|nr:peroxidase family protein [Candidatus Eremiobacteraeota bacterium]